MSTPARSVAALSAAADRAAASGAVHDARGLLEEALALEPANTQLLMNFAACCRAGGDLAAALVAVDRTLALEPRHLLALLMKASLMERLGAPHRAGAAYGIALTQAPAPERTPAHLQAPLRHAREVHAQYEAALAAHLRDAVGSEAGDGAASRRRVDGFIDRLTGRRRVYHQKPVQFHYPDLPEIEFYDRETFAWLAALEAATPEIIEELVGVLNDDADSLEPYVNYPPGVPLDQWAELNHSPRWSGYHLLERGQRVEAHCQRCPKTMAAIAPLPQPHVSRRSPAAMFSVLTPRTRIPPHHGIANTRLVLHLPLIVPPGCGFRVGSETRQWRTGEAWVFDDTIEHEAWNDSDQTRTILICDLWSPHLSLEERGIVASLMEAMDEFEGGPRGDGL
jgi:aspartyl/asparaginyl beta-hydroxylase (cupin superfamily)